MADQTPTAAEGQSPEQRTTRRSVVGVVTRDKNAKTRRVEVSRLVKHPRYGKYVKQRTICYAHDELNQTVNGDTVEIMECRRLSASKRWRLVRIVKESPARQQAAKPAKTAPKA